MKISLLQYYPLYLGALVEEISCLGKMCIHFFQWQRWRKSSIRSILGATGEERKDLNFVLWLFSFCVSAYRLSEWRKSGWGYWFCAAIYKNFGQQIIEPRVRGRQIASLSFGEHSEISQMCQRPPRSKAGRELTGRNHRGTEASSETPTHYLWPSHSISLLGEGVRTKTRMEWITAPRWPI